MKRLKRAAALLLAAAGLSGCTSDPAFWDAVATGLDQAAYDLANEPVCNWYTDRYGVVRQHCQPAWQANQSVYVVPDYRDNGHRRDHDRRDDRRDRDHDRRDRDHRRGPK
jgi:hypothetical protein